LAHCWRRSILTGTRTNPDISARAHQEDRAIVQALYVQSLEAWPLQANIGTSRFGLFLACDAEGVPDDVIYSAALHALASGAVYVVAWGPGCERVHDTFDDAAVMLALDDPTRPTILTTWHADESLEEALWFFVDIAMAGHHEGLTTGAAVTVGREDWCRQIRERLADVPGLRAAVLDATSSQASRGSRCWTGEPRRGCWRAMSPAPEAHHQMTDEPACRCAPDDR
jgi:hypothetical protein